MTSNTQITRVTLFKIPVVADQQKLLAVYKDMPKNAKKDGKPYILSVTAGPTFEDQRNQGYTVVAISTFASKEDMEYYDKECEAHAALKEVARPLQQGLMTAFFQSVTS